MKLSIFYLLCTTLLFCSSCTKDKIGDDLITDTPRTEVPATLSGQWLNGNFSMSNWWGYNGAYIGNPYSSSRAFILKRNGDAEFFQVLKTNDSFCTTEALTYFSGTVAFDSTDNSFTFHPRKGNFRGFYSCKPLNNFNRKAEEHELNPFKLYWVTRVDENGQRWLITRFTDDVEEERKHFKLTNW